MHWINAFLLVGLLPTTQQLHLSGTWDCHKTFFMFLGKFGFQQTSLQEKSKSQGYIYGNITASKGHDINKKVAFVVLDSEYFVELFAKRASTNRTCEQMFNKIDKFSWDARCNVRGTQDFIRMIPCPKDKLCDEEDNPKAVIPNYQFTYRVQDTKQPRFWYVSMVACSRNSSNASACFWYPAVSQSKGSQSCSISYDVWFVNGEPKSPLDNPFEHQFSFELHDVFELYLTFFVLYTFLLPVQFYALSVQRHALPLLMTVCMCLEYSGVVLNFIHAAKFAADGVGVNPIKVFGDFTDMVSQCMFMLLLLLIVKGWTVTRMHLTSPTKIVLFSVWIAYSAASTALFIWNQVEVDRISDMDEWQTWPGWIILGFRLLIMLWFLWELRSTFLVESSLDKTTFYLHFGAGFLVWFVYLPIVSVVCTQISALWRYKTILSVTLAADFLSLCVMVHLLWPTRSYLVFNLKQLGNQNGFSRLQPTTLIESSDESQDEFTAESYTRARPASPKFSVDRLEKNTEQQRNGSRYIS